MPSAISSSAIVAADQAAQILQNAATGTGNGNALVLDSRSQQLLVSISGGLGTIIPEWSFDGGASWETASGVATTAILTALASIGVTVALARYVFAPPPGATRFRARISAFVSGALTCAVIERRLT